MVSCVLLTLNLIKMDAQEFITKKYEHNNWGLYPPSRRLVGEWLEEFAKDYHTEQLRISGVVKSLPTKEEIISEGAKQINDWLEGNTEREKQHYLIGFRRSYEYVLRRLK